MVFQNKATFFFIHEVKRETENCACICWSRGGDVDKIKKTAYFGMMNCFCVRRKGYRIKLLCTKKQINPSVDTHTPYPVVCLRSPLGGTIHIYKTHILGATLFISFALSVESIKTTHSYIAVKRHLSTPALTPVGSIRFLVPDSVSPSVWWEVHIRVGVSVSILLPLYGFHDDVFRFGARAHADASTSVFQPILSRGRCPY